MTVTTHTPGPWTADMNGCESSHGMPIITKANNHLLAMLAERNAANARLIAAAPEMLQQLKRLVYFHQTNDTPNSDPWEDARAAIAKAEGK